MIAKAVRVTFESKIPGGVQYSSLTLGFSVEAELEDDETLDVVIDQVTQLLRDKAKEHLRPMKAEQRAQVQGIGNGVPAELSGEARFQDAVEKELAARKGKRKPDTDDLDFDTGLPLGSTA